MSQRALLVVLAFAAFISLGLPDGLLGVSWPSIRGDFEIPLDSLGLLVAITTTGYLVASFGSGVVLRLLPIGSVLAVSTLAAALALLGFATAPHWWLILALGFVAGLGGGAIDASLNAYGARHFSPRTLNWLHAFFGVGTTTGPLIVTTVLGAGETWRLSYLIVGSAQLALAAVFFLTRHRWADTGTIAQDASSRSDGHSVAALRRPVVWFGMLMFFFYSGIEMAAAQWSYTVLTLGRGLPEATAGLIVSGYWGSLMVGRVLFGIVANDVPLVRTLRVCIAGSIVGALLFWINISLLVSVVGLAMIGLFFAPVFASLISLTPGRVGRDAANSAIGFQIAAAALGAATLTALAGVLGREFGLEAIALAMLVASALLLVFYEGFMRTAQVR